MELSCNIVRDLLPSYADGVASEETNAALERHLASCPACTGVLKAMRTPECLNSDDKETHEVDFLKKVKRHSQRNVFLAIFGTSLLLVGMLSLNLFVIGSRVDADAVLCSASIANSDESSVVQVHMVSIGSANALIRPEYRMDENGIATIMARSVLVSPFADNGTCELQIPMMDSVTGTQLHSVYMGDRLLWQDGVTVSMKAWNAYNAHNPYVGDISADSRLADAIGIHACGNYLNSLQTDSQPYGWTFEFQGAYSGKEVEQLNENMTEYSYLLMALVDNLGEVDWTYTDAAGNRQENELSLEKANQNLAMLVKEKNALDARELPVTLKGYSDSVLQVQQLMILLELV